MLDLIIIGAGPAGLSAAEVAGREGLSYLVIEKGTIANTIRQYPVGRTMFSTPNEVEMCEGSLKPAKSGADRPLQPAQAAPPSRSIDEVCGEGPPCTVSARSARPSAISTGVWAWAHPARRRRTKKNVTTKRMASGG